MKQNRKRSKIIDLSSHPSYEKGQEGLREKNLRIKFSSAVVPVLADMDFLITSLKMLGPRRKTVRRFVKMRLDKCRRQFFISELAACLKVQDECRCLKKYIQHLKINDARALFLYINDSIVTDMQLGQLRAVECHEKEMSGSRLSELTKKIAMSETGVNFCSAFFY